MLTVVCWKWKSRFWRRGVYDHRHVNALQKMVRMHLAIEHRFVCVTDDPEGLHCETIPLWEDPIVDVKRGLPNCYKRLKLFSQDAGKFFGERILSIDLDCVIFRDFTSLVDRHEEFVILKGRASPYNGSMWLLTAGSRPHVWESFDSLLSPSLVRRQRKDNGQRYYGSDQAWISYCCPDEATWSGDNGVYQYMNEIRRKSVPDDARIVFFAGAQKPWLSSVKVENPKIYTEYNRYL